MKHILMPVALCGAMMAAHSLEAHHSTSMYEGSKTVTGKVLRFEWTNPHAHIYVETQDEDGTHRTRGAGTVAPRLRLDGQDGSGRGRDLRDRCVRTERRSRDDRQPHDPRRRPRDLLVEATLDDWRNEKR